MGDRRDDVPDQPPGSEVPGEGKVAAAGSAERRDPAVPSPDLGDLDRVVESDDEGRNQRATGDDRP